MHLIGKWFSVPFIFLYWCEIWFSEYAVPFDKIHTISKSYTWTMKKKELKQLTSYEWNILDASCVPLNTVSHAVWSNYVTSMRKIERLRERKKPMLFWYFLYVLLSFPLHFIYLLFFTRGKTFHFAISYTIIK